MVRGEKCFQKSVKQYDNVCCGLAILYNMSCSFSDK